MKTKTQCWNYYILKMNKYVKPSDINFMLIIHAKSALILLIIAQIKLYNLLIKALLKKNDGHVTNLLK